MLKPAILYKEEIENKLMEMVYSEEYFLYYGYPHAHELPKIELSDDKYQWAIVDSDSVIGYLSYSIKNDQCYNFGMVSFKGNPSIFIHDILSHLETLIKNYHRIEWCCIGGNPVLKAYKDFCKKT